ncbi:hypothetical protein O181_118463 [Austropuccinia psidii MF-1]|uniref:Uncharacterized protein n=1 Tax=Austropuccinia psidii MF-1 TaxID=1389203 RepID=A0A9Q3PYG4_9BASI|nr:hypothetical protein [Austropuccinia psidii MF-1]
MGVAAIQPGTKLGPIGHTISFMANWPPLVFYGPLAIAPSPGHILPSLAFLANFHIPNPQASIFVFGTGGVLLSPKGLWPPWKSPSSLGHPLSLGGLGLFRPPTASTAHGLWANQAPFGPIQ